MSGHYHLLVKRVMNANEVDNLFFSPKNAFGEETKSRHTKHKLSNQRKKYTKGHISEHEVYWLFLFVCLNESVTTNFSLALQT